MCSRLNIVVRWKGNPTEQLKMLSRLDRDENTLSMMTYTSGPGDLWCHSQSITLGDCFEYCYVVYDGDVECYRSDKRVVLINDPFVTADDGILNKNGTLRTYLQDNVQLRLLFGIGTLENRY